MRAEHRHSLEVIFHRYGITRLLEEVAEICGDRAERLREINEENVWAPHWKALADDIRMIETDLV